MAWDLGGNGFSFIFQKDIHPLDSEVTCSKNSVATILYITTSVYVVVQFYPWFKFYFLLFLGMVMYDNEFETKENKNLNQG